VRLLEPQAMHVTLCFLGNRPVAEIETLAAVLGGCEARAAELQLGAPLWLPPRSPRTLSVEVHDRAGSLARLHEALSGAIARAIAWQPERRRFRAHVTVARIGREARTGRRVKGRGRGGELPATPAVLHTLGARPVPLVAGAGRSELRGARDVHARAVRVEFFRGRFGRRLSDTL
jgi:2'-5' RNA ligase